MIKVRNMKSPKTGRSIANQFILEVDNLDLFQSYNSIIAKKDYDNEGEITLDKNSWNYSRTTSKYRNIFLSESTKETERKIRLGIYKLEDLN